MNLNGPPKPNPVPRRPNVILVLTDDQGYGDLGCTGNPWIRTPNIDRFHDDAIRFTDFHVSPLCTPTRGAIMTGRYPLRNGAWATCWGRSILRRDELTLAEVFAANGYRTGMFGKWHLGDNYPYRPQDRGFQTVVAHKGGGVGQTPDFWGNDYFDDTYFHNGQPVPHAGYCTDVWFQESARFIEANRDRPFFCYLATNAPHSPYLVDERYAHPYRGNPAIPEPAFYGMIANIDENFGRLRDTLQRLRLEDDTILIFMTDNGSSGGWREQARQGYNAGMRGAKGSYYDGGHRVPFFVRWPAAGARGGRDVRDLVAHVDLLPTFVDLCGLTLPRPAAPDGLSAASPFRGEPLPAAFSDRPIFVQYRQNTQPPDKWENAVLNGPWRLVAGRELYDIASDPGQRNDLAAARPDIAARLRAAHEAWWTEVSPALEAYCPIALGNPAENPTRLTSMDVLGDVAWHQAHVMAAMRSAGTWAVDVERPGAYRFSLRRWPEELPLPLAAPLPDADAEHLMAITNWDRARLPSRAIQPVKARLRLFRREWIAPATPHAEEVEFVIPVERAGETRLQAHFLDAAGEEIGAYYVTVERLP